MKNKYDEIRRNIETVIHKALTSKFLTDDFFMSENICADDFAEILKSVSHLVESGGKRWRAVLLVLCAQLYSAENTARAIELAPVVEFIHTASLIHDDIEDASETRRGKPAAHILFGIDTALNSGSWLYFFALKLLSTVQFTPAEKCFIQEITVQAIYNLHIGQALDIKWHSDEKYFPSVADYEKMIRLKTGTLAGLAGALGVFSASDDSAQASQMSLLMHEVGIAFQILDDVKNITEGVVGKNRGDDIVEGKKSLPVIFHIEEKPEDSEKLAALFKTAKHEGIRSTAVAKAIAILHQSTCIERSTKYAHKKIAQVQNRLSAHYNNDALADLFAFIESLIR